MAFPEPFVIQPSGQHTHTIIFIHGRNSDGQELAEELFEGRTTAEASLDTALAWNKNCKWIFPSAPARFSTVFQEDLTEWFDIYSLTDTDAEQERQITGLRESIDHTRTIVEQETASIPPSRIILAGISQGFGIATHVLLSCGYDFGGVIGSCGWIPFQKQLRDVLRQTSTLRDVFEKKLGLAHVATRLATGVPVFIAHAENDAVVDLRHGIEACRTLRGLGFVVEFHTYDSDAHWIPEPQGYDDLVAFLKRVSF